MNNPLARREELKVAELRADPILMFRRERNPDLYDLMVHGLRRAGAAGRIIERADHGSWNWRLIATDTCWQLVRRSALKGVDAPPGTCCVPLADFELPFGLDAIWSDQNQSEAMQLFLLLAKRPRCEPSSQEAL